MEPQLSEEVGVFGYRSRRKVVWPMERDDDLLDALVQSQERLWQIEQSIELLSWLPTSAVWSFIDAMRYERMRLDQLARLLSWWRHDDDH